MITLDEIAPKYAQGRGYLAYTQNGIEHRCLLGLILETYIHEVAPLAYTILLLPRSHMCVRVYEEDCYLHLPSRVSNWAGLCAEHQHLVSDINDSQDDLGPTWWREVATQFQYVARERGLPHPCIPGLMM